MVRAWWGGVGWGGGWGDSVAPAGAAPCGNHWQHCCELNHMMAA
jgi:hypothetical protein